MLTGVLLVDKARGMTSHDVVARVRRIFGQREVGHTGTLDPMATGLLVLMLGRATRLARFVEATEKAYEATVTLGVATTTFDAEGEVTERAEVRAGEGEVRDALAALTGEIEQEVPAFSAVKVGGERLYAKARRGEAVEAPSRTVVIHELRLVRFEGGAADIEVVCSKGTYVRTLAVQIGERLGLPAHLSRLRRTRVGRFSVSDAAPLDVLRGAEDELRSVASAVEHLPSLELDERAAGDVVHGRPLRARQVASLGGVEAGPVALLFEGRLVAVGEASALDGLGPDERAMGYAVVLGR
jgi:tRNA pseudouridine55 synthase